MEEPNRANFARIYFKGKATVWYGYYQAKRGDIHWRTFSQDVIIRFEKPKNMDVQDQFNKIKQCVVVVLKIKQCVWMLDVVDASLRKLTYLSFFAPKELKRKQD